MMRKFFLFCLFFSLAATSIAADNGKTLKNFQILYDIQSDQQQGESLKEKTVDVLRLRLKNLNIEGKVDRQGNLITAQWDGTDEQYPLVKKALENNSVLQFREKSGRRWRKTKLTNEYILSVRLQKTNTSGENGFEYLYPVISITFDKKGAEIFQKLTSRNIGKPLRMMLNKKIIFEPVVQETIKDGQAIIAGMFTEEEAEKLLEKIPLGKLPLRIIPRK